MREKNNTRRISKQRNTRYSVCKSNKCKEINAKKSSHNFNDKNCFSVSPDQIKSACLKCKNEGKNVDYVFYCPDCDEYWIVLVKDRKNKDEQPETPDSTHEEHNDSFPDVEVSSTRRRTPAGVSYLPEGKSVISSESISSEKLQGTFQEQTKSYSHEYSEKTVSHMSDSDIESQSSSYISSFSTDTFEMSYSTEIDAEPEAHGEEANKSTSKKSTSGSKEDTIDDLGSSLTLTIDDVRKSNETNRRLSSKTRPNDYGSLKEYTGFINMENPLNDKKYVENVDETKTVEQTRNLMNIGSTVKISSEKNPEPNNIIIPDTITAGKSFSRRSHTVDTGDDKSFIDTFQTILKENENQISEEQGTYSQVPSRQPQSPSNTSLGSSNTTGSKKSVKTVTFDESKTITRLTTPEGDLGSETSSRVDKEFQKKRPIIVENLKKILEKEDLVCDVPFSIRVDVDLHNKESDDKIYDLIGDIQEHGIIPEKFDDKKNVVEIKTKDETTQSIVTHPSSQGKSKSIELQLRLDIESESNVFEKETVSSLKMSDFDTKNGPNTVMIDAKDIMHTDIYTESKSDGHIDESQDQSTESKDIGQKNSEVRDAHKMQSQSSSEIVSGSKSESGHGIQTEAYSLGEKNSQGVTKTKSESGSVYEIIIDIEKVPIDYQKANLITAEQNIIKPDMLVFTQGDANVFRKSQAKAQAELESFNEEALFENEEFKTDIPSEHASYIQVLQSQVDSNRGLGHETSEIETEPTELKSVKEKGMSESVETLSLNEEEQILDNKDSNETKNGPDKSSKNQVDEPTEKGSKDGSDPALSSAQKNSSNPSETTRSSASKESSISHLSQLSKDHKETSDISPEKSGTVENSPLNELKKTHNSSSERFKTSQSLNSYRLVQTTEESSPTSVSTGSTISTTLKDSAIDPSERTKRGPVIKKPSKKGIDRKTPRKSKISSQSETKESSLESSENIKNPTKSQPKNKTDKILASVSSKNDTTKSNSIQPDLQKSVTNKPSKIVSEANTSAEFIEKKSNVAKKDDLKVGDKPTLSKTSKTTIKTSDSKISVKTKGDDRSQISNAPQPTESSISGEPQGKNKSEIASASKLNGPLSHENNISESKEVSSMVPCSSPCSREDLNNSTAQTPAAYKALSTENSSNIDTFSKSKTILTIPKKLSSKSHSDHSIPHVHDPSKSSEHGEHKDIDSSYKSVKTSALTESDPTIAINEKLFDESKTFASSVTGQSFDITPTSTVKESKKLSADSSSGSSIIDTRKIGTHSSLEYHENIQSTVMNSIAELKESLSKISKSLNENEKLLKETHTKIYDEKFLKDSKDKNKTITQSDNSDEPERHDSNISDIVYTKKSDMDKPQSVSENSQNNINLSTTIQSSHEEPEETNEFKIREGKGLTKSTSESTEKTIKSEDEVTHDGTVTDQISGNLSKISENSYRADLGENESTFKVNTKELSAEIHDKSIKNNRPEASSIITDQMSETQENPSEVSIKDDERKNHSSLQVEIKKSHEKVFEKSIKEGENGSKIIEENEEESLNKSPERSIKDDTKMTIISKDDEENKSSVELSEKSIDDADGSKITDDEPKEEPQKEIKEKSIDDANDDSKVIEEQQKEEPHKEISEKSFYGANDGSKMSEVVQKEEPHKVLPEKSVDDVNDSCSKTIEEDEKEEPKRSLSEKSDKKEIIRISIVKDDKKRKLSMETTEKSIKDEMFSSKSVKGNEEKESFEDIHEESIKSLKNDETEILKGDETKEVSAESAEETLERKEIGRKNGTDANLTDISSSNVGVENKTHQSMLKSETLSESIPYSKSHLQEMERSQVDKDIYCQETPSNILNEKIKDKKDMKITPKEIENAETPQPDDENQIPRNPQKDFGKSIEKNEDISISSRSLNKDETRTSATSILETSDFDNTISRIQSHLGSNDDEQVNNRREYQVLTEKDSNKNVQRREDKDQVMIPKEDQIDDQKDDSTKNPTQVGTITPDDTDKTKKSSFISNEDEQRLEEKSNSRIVDKKSTSDSEKNKPVPGEQYHSPTNDSAMNYSSITQPSLDASSVSRVAPVHSVKDDSTIPQELEPTVNIQHQKNGEEPCSIIKETPNNEESPAQGVETPTSTSEITNESSETLDYQEDSIPYDSSTSFFPESSSRADEDVAPLFHLKRTKRKNSRRVQKRREMARLFSRMTSSTSLNEKPSKIFGKGRVNQLIGYYEHIIQKYDKQNQQH